MTASRLISAIALIVTLGACATATPYQAAFDSNRGYADQQIEANRWQVSFAGNSLTDRQTVETYLLYRAAELTLQQGYDHFSFVKRDTDANRRYIPTGFGSDFGYGFYPYDFRFYSRSGRLFGHPRGFYGGGYYDPFWGDRYDIREVVRYEALAEIVMGKGDKPADDPAYFTANEVQMNLSTRIVRPEAG
ncbi:MAG: hypothetical protein Hens3KO_01000 [Henriciella sp.]